MQNNPLTKNIRALVVAVAISTAGIIFLFVETSGFTQTAYPHTVFRRW